MRVSEADLSLFGLIYCAWRACHPADLDCIRLAREHGACFPQTMNSKNWNDRADKDLFFTILSVKNIGVISGAEWTTIGQHMRTLGYGFSNEGCRYVQKLQMLL
jgi:hypothetical protein